MDVSHALEALRRALLNAKFALRGTQEYSSLNSSTYQSGLNIDISPACLFQPQTEEEVANFLNTIRPFVIAGGAAFAIAGGGRQPAPDCSNINDGITVNLSLLKCIDVQVGRVSIAAGELWSSVYDKLGEQGLGCAGSRLVLNYEIVLASGDIVNANANDNTDLWVALRDGGNNFGVVTRFDMRTFKQGQMYGGSIYYTGATFPSQAELLVSKLQKPNATDKTHLMVSLGYTAAFGPDPVGLNQLYYKDEVETPSVLEPFTPFQAQIPGLNTLRLHTLAEASREQAGEVSTLQRSAYMNTHVRANIACLLAGAKIWQAALEPIKSCEGLICSYTLQPYPLSLLAASDTKGGNSLGLDAAHGPVVSIALLGYWNNAGDDDRILNAFKGALEKIDQEAKTSGQALDFKFMNYSFTFQDPIGSYGSENKMRLQDVSRKFDPEDVFQKGVPGVEVVRLINVAKCQINTRPLSTLYCPCSP
ncbi:Uu.00g033140.m01.CDS01 [Anthostomella pinea]|uniref:Uu.00g033140.m01.CDS01 n=1 Tax=Anthostomella pinea TaxID=933095 RepID=A0AAI8YD55_9PEZI|nr:Uu.00g033140.m01.CDS01 [Anthostomella pinea]